MTLDAKDFVVFTLFPSIKGFLHDTRVGQDVAVAAEELGFRNFRLGEGVRCLGALFSTQ